jgi:hypothetical protein
MSIRGSYRQLGMADRQNRGEGYREELLSAPINNSFSGYPFNAGQLEYDYRYSKTPGMPVTGGRGFRSLKPLWHIVSRLKWVPSSCSSSHSAPPRMAIHVFSQGEF